MKITRSRLNEILKEEMQAFQMQEKHSDGGLAIANETHDQEAAPDMFGEPDEEGGMARSELLKIAKYGAELRDMLQDVDQLPAWVQSKITKAAQMMGDVKHFIEGELQNMQVDKPQEMAMDEQSDFDVSLEEVESVVAEEINSVLQQTLQEKKN